MIIQHIAPTVASVVQRVLSPLLCADTVDVLDDVHAVVLIGEQEVPLEQRLRAAAHRVHTDVLRIQVICERRERRRLRIRTVGEQIAVECFENIGDLRDQLIRLHLPEHCDQHALLTVDTVRIALLVCRKSVHALAHAAVIQKALPVYVLQALFIGTSLDLERNVHVVFQTAAQVDQFLQRRHGDRIIIVDLNAAEHPLRRIADLFESLRVEGTVVVVQTAAAIQRGVQLIDALDIRNICIRVARKRDQIGAVLFEIDREHHHDVRMPFLFPVPRFALGGIVNADKQHVDNVLHHRGVGFFTELHVRVDRGRRSRRIRRILRYCSGRRFAGQRCVLRYRRDKTGIGRIRVRSHRFSSAGADVMKILARSTV